MGTPSGERRCPGCGRLYRPVTGSTYRPFCSERCQLIDLGDWLTEKHRIKGDELLQSGESGEETP